MLKRSKLNELCERADNLHVAITRYEEALSQPDDGGGVFIRISRCSIRLPDSYRDSALAAAREELGRLKAELESIEKSITVSQ